LEEIKMAKLDKVKNPVVTVDIGDKVRTIKYDMNSYAALEEKFGSVQAAMDLLQTGSFKAVRDVLWAGLIHEEVELDEETGEPKKFLITPYQVGGWIGPNDMEEVTEKLTLALNGSLPDNAKTTQAADANTLPNGVVIELTPAEKEAAKREQEEKNV